MRRSPLWLLVAALAGCADDGSPAPCCAACPPTVAAAIPDTSIHHLEHRWRDQQGREVTLRELGGRPALLAMIFTHCQYACPAIVGDVKKLLAALPATAADTRVVYATMDPERDTPEVLAAFAKTHGLPAEQYTLLHGSADAVRDLAAVLGVRYAQVAGGDFSHSNQIALLDRQGTVVFRLEGLNTDPAPLLQRLAEAPVRD
ncbi:MAG: SCO family protein [Planctomycetes bacterium]|nr:SCO family protein [Planctomycetota bacterium]